MVVKMPETVLPMPPMAAMQTITMAASITAYSVVVGPSSAKTRAFARFRKSLMRFTFPFRVVAWLASRATRKRLDQGDFYSVRNEGAPRQVVQRPNA